MLLKAKRNPVILKYQAYQNLNDLQLCVFNDASFGNLKSGGSQGGFIIYITDEDKKCSPVMWQSKKLQRVVKSTMAAETLIQVEAAESAFWLRKLFKEFLIENDNHSINCYTDNRQLHDAVYSIKPIQDKRLRIDIAILREMILNGEVDRIDWVDTHYQLADCLTKYGASSEKLLETFRLGYLPSEGDIVL